MPSLKFKYQHPSTEVLVIDEFNDPHDISEWFEKIGSEEWRRLVAAGAVLSMQNGRDMSRAIGWFESNLETKLISSFAPI
jgi:hypothetical protein